MAHLFGQWASPFAVAEAGTISFARNNSTVSVARNVSADRDDFVHIPNNFNDFTFQEKKKTSPPEDAPRSQQTFQTYAGRLRSASGTDMDDDRHSKLGRIPSLGSWRASVRRSVAHLTHNRHLDSNKEEKHLVRHGSSPGGSRSSTPLGVPRSNSLQGTPSRSRPPPVYRSYSSGSSQNTLPGPSAPPLCRSPSSAMSTVSSTEASDYAALFTASRTAQRASKSTNNLADTLGRPRVKYELLNTTPSVIIPSSPRFAPPNLDEVIPFSSSPFCAWGDPAAVNDDVLSPTRHMPRKGSDASAPVAGGSAWHEPSRRRGAPGARRTWRTESGKDIRSVYPVGWERPVLDLESRLHETMYEIAGGQHTFVDYEDDEQPKAVLDLGTGTGLWAISQALAWPEARFIAADLVPCQTDLNALANAEDRARTSSGGTAPGMGQWSSVADRVEFQQFDFLDGLPYDSGVFDMVHMRFLGLGIPEHRWGDLLDEAVRILKPGGVLEIVEMSYEMPPSVHPRTRKAYSRLLVDDYLAANPIFALQLNLPATVGIVPASTRPVFSAQWDIDAPYEPCGCPDLFPAHNPPPDALADAAMTWARSALDYKDVQRGDEGERALRALVAADPRRWDAPPAGDKGMPDTPRTPSTPGPPYTPPFGDATCSGKVAVAAWMVVKRS